MHTELKFSTIGQFLSGDSGILQLMDDLGAALDQNHKSVHVGGWQPCPYSTGSSVPSIMPRGNPTPTSNSLMNSIGSYDAPQGNVKFIEVVASLLQSECGWPVGCENIAVTNGSQSSFFTLFNLFAGQCADGRPATDPTAVDAGIYWLR